MILQFGRQKDQRKNQRETVGLDPQRIIQLFGLGRQLQLVLDAALGGRDDVDAENILERPARFHRIGELAHGLVETLAHAWRLRHRPHFRKRSRNSGFHVRIIDQVGHSRTDIAERRAAAFGQGMQHLVAAGFLLDAARDVFDGQHVAGHRRRGSSPGSEYRHHLGAQQLAAARVVMKLDSGRLAGRQALADDFLRMLDLVLFEDGENRTPEADQAPPETEVGPWAKALNCRRARLL
jgi:hypothetical protein